MSETISYDTATAARKLSEAITEFGIHAKILAPDVGTLSGPQLMHVLADARDLISSANELIGAAKAVGKGITVDIFWERQGYYFVHIDDLSKVSPEHPSLDACVRYIVLHGYTLRDVHRTRRSVRQPTPPVQSKKASDVE